MIARIDIIYVTDSDPDKPYRMRAYDEYGYYISQVRYPHDYEASSGARKLQRDYCPDAEIRDLVRKEERCLP